MVGEVVEVKVTDPVALVVMEALMASVGLTGWERSKRTKKEGILIGREVCSRGPRLAAHAKGARGVSTEVLEAWRLAASGGVRGVWFCRRMSEICLLHGFCTVLLPALYHTPQGLRITPLT